MLPVNRVIASATRACSVASASSRSRRALRVAIFLARTELRPGGFGEGLVGDPGPAERPLALPFPTGDMFAFLAREPDLNEPKLRQLGSALSLPYTVATIAKPEPRGCSASTASPTSRASRCST